MRGWDRWPAARYSRAGGGIMGCIMHCLIIKLELIGTGVFERNYARTVGTNVHRGRGVGL